MSERDILEEYEVRKKHGCILTFLYCLACVFLIIASAYILAHW